MAPWGGVNPFPGAWRAACGDEGTTGAPTLYVPAGREQFLLSPDLNFKGPCRSGKVRVQVRGETSLECEYLQGREPVRARSVRSNHGGSRAISLRFTFLFSK